MTALPQGPITKAGELMLSTRLMTAIEAVEELRTVRVHCAPDIPTVPGYLRDKVRSAIAELAWWENYTGAPDV